MSDTQTTKIAATDPALTSALGELNQYGSSIIPLIAPEVQVYNRYFKARVFGKDKLKKVVKVSRPRGGTPERIIQTLQDPKNFSVEEKTLRDVLDRRDRDEAVNAPDGGFDLRLQYAANVEGQLNTTIEYGIASMFLNETNYASAAKTAVGTTFSGTGTLATIRTQRNRIIKTWAINPNVLILTSDAWDEVQDNATINARLQYTNGDTITEEMVARYLQLDRVIVPRTVWFDDAGAGSYIWSGKKALLLAAPQNPGMNGPAFAKTFHRNIDGQRQVVRTHVDQYENEEFIVAREEETAIVFNDAAHIWY
jgi:hypothetical protein